MKNKWKSTIAVALSAVLSVAATGITASAETSNTELSVVTKENDLNVISDVSDLITDHETIITMLNDFVKGNQLSDVRIGDDKTSGKVILSYYYVYPEQGDMFKNFISEKNIDANEIMILVMEGAIEAPDKEEENSLITDHETIITLLNGFIKDNQLSDVRIGDDKSSGKVILSYYYVYPEQGDMFKNFISENSIDANEITILVMEGAIEAPDKEEENSLITDHETIIAMLNDFIKENQLADAFASDDKSFGKVIISYYYVHPEQKDMFKNFISEMSIDANEVEFSVMEGAIEVPDKAEENSLITDHDTIIAMLNNFIKEKQLADVIVGDDKPSGKVILSYYYVHPEQEDMFKSFISEKNIDADEITFLVMEGTGETPDKSNDSPLPQTGYSKIHKAIAGLAALMTATGTALVVKSKKKDE